MNSMFLAKRLMFTFAFGVSLLAVRATKAESTAESASLWVYPAYSGAVTSTLYSVKANGTEVFTEKMTKFTGHMQVHYAHFSAADTVNVTVEVSEDFKSHILHPESRKIATKREGNTISFTSGPNYLILELDDKELLFILIDSPEKNPPKLGDSNVKNIMDYGVDNQGNTLETKKIQSAIDAASGAEKNILYFPPGKYLVGELWLKSDMTVYLAGGAVLFGSANPADFNTGNGGVNIEGMQHALIRILNCKNTKLIGRGVIDGNGRYLRSERRFSAAVLKMDNSSEILVDGIISRDSSYWNTIPYRCSNITIKNYKVINSTPESSPNNTDGVNYTECVDCSLYNAFLYCGDDCMAVKNENAVYDGKPTMDIKNIVHEKVVTYSCVVGCKIGTKTEGKSMDNVVFRDIDVIKAGRALVIDAYDTALITNTVFENIRIKDPGGQIIVIEGNKVPAWRRAVNQSIVKDTYFRNVSCEMEGLISLQGKDAEHNITGVHFDNVTVAGKRLASQDDPAVKWTINEFVGNVTFK